MRIATVLMAATLAACQGVDVPLPPGYEALVESARSSVLSNYEGLLRPGLAVTQIRCFANGGVVIMFRQVGGRTPGKPAFAMGGQEPNELGTHSWSGGYGDLDDIEGEIEFNFGDVPEMPCPPRAS